MFTAALPPEQIGSKTESKNNVSVKEQKLKTRMGLMTLTQHQEAEKAGEL